MNEPESTQPKGVSRRTVSKAMAWAVPTIAVAATVPMAAASCIPKVGVTDDSCKKANSSSYFIKFDLLGDPTCAPPAGCLGNVLRLRYKGNNKVFWTSPQINNGGTIFGVEIILCAITPANGIEAEVSISCLNGGVPFWTPYTIDMPQVSNGKCLDPAFCA